MSIITNNDLKEKNFEALVWYGINSYTIHCPEWEPETDDEALKAHCAQVVWQFATKSRRYRPEEFSVKREEGSTYVDADGISFHWYTKEWIEAGLEEAE